MNLRSMYRNPGYRAVVVIFAGRTKPGLKAFARSCASLTPYAHLSCSDRLLLNNMAKAARRWLGSKGYKKHEASSCEI